MTSPPDPIDPAGSIVSHALPARKPRRGDELECEIADFDARGLARGHGGGYRVESERGVPGERMRAQVLSRRRDVVRVRRVETLEPSPDAVEPRCAHFGSCGGCSFQDLRYARQLELKRDLVARTLAAHGATPREPLGPVLGAREPWNYRTKMDFTFSDRRWVEIGEPDDAPRDFAVGLHPRGFHGKVLDVRACEIQFAQGNAILASVRELALERRLRPWDIQGHAGLLRHLVLRRARATGEILVNLVTSEEAPDDVRPLANALVARHPEITTLVQNVHAKPAQAALSEREIVLHGPGFVRERVGGLWFRLSANSFFQTNAQQAEVLFDVVAREAAVVPTDVALDLYCGAGAFTLGLARSAREALGFELVESAVADARANALENGVRNAHFVAGDLARTIASPDAFGSGAERTIPDVAVVDPPRAGVHAAVLAALAKLAPRRVVYVSCNVASGARDAAGLIAAGYELVRASAIDLFPHTPHVETVLVLERSR